MAKRPSAPSDLNWLFSSTCDGGACVMVARDGDSVVFGNSAQPDGPVFAYTRAEWNEFLTGVKRGDFDDL
jgi:predicted secreted Zn-dependent protease